MKNTAFGVLVMLIALEIYEKKKGQMACAVLSYETFSLVSDTLLNIC